MNRLSILLIIFAITLSFSSGCSSNDPNSDLPTLAEQAYIENKGSDTIVNLALVWAETYQKEHPEVRISVTGGGSGTGIAAMLNGTVTIANSSRAISKDELQQAAEKNILPIEHIIAKDAIAIIVNPQNPVARLTLQQLSDIYSGKISNWKELGGEDRQIVRLSRETNSGTHVYFLEHVLRLGNKENTTLFSPDTLLLPSSEGIINELRSNPNAIGYDGLGYVPEDLKMVEVSKDGIEPYMLPSADTVNNNQYPIARDLYMYTAGEPNDFVQQYLDWILTAQAQQIVQDLGFVPVSKE